MTYRKVGTGGPGRAQGRTFPRGRRQAEADVAGVVLGWWGGGGQGPAGVAFSSATAEDATLPQAHGCYF